MRIGIIGAGRMAQSIGWLAVQAGHDVMLSNSRGPHTLDEPSRRIGCVAGTAYDAAEFGNVVCIAIHLQDYQTVPKAPLVGKTVLNPQNYFPHLGRIAELDCGELTTAELLARHLPESRTVKALNAILAEDLIPDARPAGAEDRRALPIAGDDLKAKSIASRFLDQIGYDTVDAGLLTEGWRFERCRPVYCRPLGTRALQEMLLGTTPDSKVPEGHWYAYRSHQARHQQ
jgi:8-hydroxy-5-deazaflavin:NADPH oxidoreductase